MVLLHTPHFKMLIQTHGPKKIVDLFGSIGYRQFATSFAHGVMGSNKETQAN
jgi:hypothetical protein